MQQASTVKQSLCCIAVLQHIGPQTKTCMQHIFHATLALHSRFCMTSLQVLPVLAPTANQSQSFIRVTLRRPPSPAPTHHITSTACKGDQTAVYLYLCMHRISKYCSLDVTLGGYQISSKGQCYTCQNRMTDQQGRLALTQGTFSSSSSSSCSSSSSLAVVPVSKAMVR